MEEKEKIDIKAERQKLIGIGLIMLILIFFVFTLFSKLYKKEGENQKQERVEQILKELEDEFN